MNNIILGIAGRKRSGKSTAGTLAADTFNFIQINFADPIRAAACSLFDYTPEQLETHKHDVHPLIGISPRKFMQMMGTEFGRNMIDQDLWLKSVKNKIMNRRQYDIAICDVRYPNEADFVHRMGGKVLHITRPDMQDSAETHSSETEVDSLPADFRLTNDADLYTFKDRVKALIGRLLGYD